MTTIYRGHPHKCAKTLFFRQDLLDFEDVFTEGNEENEGKILYCLCCVLC